MTVFIQKVGLYDILEHNEALQDNNNNQKIRETVYEKLERLPILLNLPFYKKDPDVFFVRGISILEGHKAHYVRRDCVARILSKARFHLGEDTVNNILGRITVLPTLCIADAAMKTRVENITMKASYPDGHIVRKEFLCLYPL